MDDLAPWQPLLSEALAILALAANEQVRVNAPGCVACDLLNDFDQARKVAVESKAILSNGQRRILEAIDNVILSMEGQDLECCNNEVLRRPAWEQLRELAAEGLRLFGWQSTVVEPFTEVQPGVWRRPPLPRD